MAKEPSGKKLKDPNFRTGLEIFASRPVSLIAALILSIVICLITFMLLTLPVIAGYYYAVRKSRRERYFVDLNSLSETLASLFKGIGRYFVQSYVFGIPAILSVLILYIIPLIPIQSGGDGMYIGTLLLILWLPAFFLTGVFIFNGYPYLIATNDGIGALRYAFSEGKAKPIEALAKGFLILSPIPGLFVHFFMVFSYPIIVGWAVAQTDNTKDTGVDIPGAQKVILGKLLLVLGFVAIWLVICYVLVTLWEATGFWIWLVLFFISTLFLARKFK